MAFKSKKSHFKNKDSFPLPVSVTIQSEEEVEKHMDVHIGIFTGVLVEVCNRKSVEILHRNGCFGTGSRSLTTPSFLKVNSEKHDTQETHESLMLFPEEAFFLLHFVKCLTIEDGEEKVMDTEAVLLKYCAIKPDFMSSLVAYVYLRSKNWVVKSGLKFAGDFLVYKRGPEFFHASFLVLVHSQFGQKALNAVELQGLYRVAQTAGKDVILLEVNDKSSSKDVREHLNTNFKQFTITENSPKRFILK